MSEKLIEFTSKYKYQKDSLVYLVPVYQKESGAYWPRCPVGGWSAYYNANKTEAVLVASKTASAYLNKRSYAKKIGFVKFVYNGNIEKDLQKIGFGRFNI